MFKTIVLNVSALIISTSAFAAGTHSGGHDNADGHHQKMTIGQPGKASKVTRVINVVMRETDAGDMVFEPASLEVKKGETVRFKLVNKGELEHEFVMDDPEGIAKHKASMEKFPEMEHDDPNAARLEPGETGEIIWTFTNDGSFEFACLIPGHYEAGMKGHLRVTEHLANN